jgi:hypothetical protein
MENSVPFIGYLWISPGAFYLSLNFSFYLGKDQLSQVLTLFF